MTKTVGMFRSIKRRGIADIFDCFPELAEMTKELVIKPVSANGIAIKIQRKPYPSSVEKSIANQALATHHKINIPDPTPRVMKPVASENQKSHFLFIEEYAVQ